MLVELLTPFMLVTSPATFPPLPPARYDHHSQRLISEGEKTKTAYNTFTSNGTQTYAYNGRPSDADNDQD
ncbi:MAG: hypothetical protein P4L61_04475 [Candidatus Pacebacteria bacterium]|nr:hypothetical protein [Candidatus Paceibacterota bacterium]